MNCHYCRGLDTCENTTTLYLCYSARRPFYVENLPVFECVQCGEQLLSEEVMDILDKIDNGEMQAIRQQSILVYDFSNLEAADYPLLSTNAKAGFRTAPTALRVNSSSPIEVGVGRVAIPAL